MEKVAKKATKAAAIAAEEKPISGGYVTPAIPRRNGTFIITAVQNNTELHAEFARDLSNYAKEIGATVISCPILYNKNAWAQPDDAESSADGLWFAWLGEIVKERVILNDSVLLVGNAHVLPTAKNPLSGFDAAGEAGQWIVIPASKIALNCQPALKGEQGKTLVSTGTATLCNYVQRKAGMTAELHHSFGFVIVEPGQNPRSVEYKNGEFFDYNGASIYSSHAGSYVKNEGVGACLVLGDIHAEKCDEVRKTAIFSIVENVKPMACAIHDLHDFTSRNHHNRKNPFFRFEQDSKGNSVEKDIYIAGDFLRELGNTNDNMGIYVITSNHDLALNRWIEEADWREDTINAECYLMLAQEKIKAMREGRIFNALESGISRIYPERLPNVYFNGTDESLMFYGVELGHHGDKGANGARGSISGFAKLGQSMVIGHSHSPAVQLGVYQVGVSGNMSMGYNEGPSSWRHAHCLVFPNGQKQLIME